MSYIPSRSHQREKTKMTTLSQLTEAEAGKLFYRLMDLRDGLDNAGARRRTSKMIRRVACFVADCATGADINWQWRV